MSTAEQKYGPFVQWIKIMFTYSTAKKFQPWYLKQSEAMVWEHGNYCGPKLTFFSF